MITSAEPSGEGLLIRCRLDSLPASVSATLRAVRRQLCGAAPALDRDLPWELVVAEVLNNIVEHAYHDAPGGEIRARLRFCPQGLRADFTDHGSAMPGLRLPVGAAVPLDMGVADLPEGGFGWFLIHTLARDLHYRREAGANRLTLRVPRGE